MTDWNKPQTISDVLYVFPATVIGVLLPGMDEIPTEFHNLQHPWCRYAQKLMGGVAEDNQQVLREELDVETVRRHVFACLRSFEPRHEHKLAGVAYLLSLWFEPYPAEPPAEKSES